MNAYQTTWETLNIRKENHPIILIVTALNILQSGKEKCLVAGISDFINKPISISKIQEKLNIGEEDL